jgi:hypothetical protein
LGSACGGGLSELDDCDPAAVAFGGGAEGVGLPSAVEKDTFVVVLCTQVVAQAVVLVRTCSPVVGAMLDQESLPNQALDHVGALAATGRRRTSIPSSSCLQLLVLQAVLHQLEFP